MEEVEEILASVVPAGPLGQRDLAALELLYGCGLRVSELVGLRDGDVDIEGGLVRCVGKGDKERVVPMGSAAAAAVSRYVADGRRVQEMLGHANVATTQLYTHVTVDHLREVFLETHPRARRRRGEEEEQ